MFLNSDNAHLVLGILVGGLGVIFFLTDREGRSSRPIALCLFVIGLTLLIEREGSPQYRLLTAAIQSSLESIAILAGFEWGRRIGQTASGGLQTAANWLFRIAQLLGLGYWLLSLLYIVLFPKQAASFEPGVIRIHILQAAMLAPILGAALICSVVAIGLLLLAKIDKAEAIRLRVLVFASPFLLAALVMEEKLVPFSMAVGVLIFLFGSIRYLMVQSRRGQFMAQFLSPQVTRMVRSEGMDRVLKRQQRSISIVVCDLRGFTAFSHAHDSETVVRVLEHYYEMVGKVAMAHSATVKDHAGDGVLILVGAPLPVKNSPQRAAQLALQLMQAWRERRGEQFPTLGLGIGIATGVVTIGAIQGASRLEYVAVGNAVNLASRLCSRAEDGEILIDADTLAALAPEESSVAVTRPPEQLKGFEEAVPVFALAQEPAAVMA